MQPNRLTVYVRLARATTIATYLLILVGALVRAAGAGLGCPDWPKCYGQWVPPVSVSQLPAGFDASTFNPLLTWMEYTNRLLGVSIGLLITATFVVALLWHRRRPRILWPSMAAWLLVGFQGWLGGQVVRSGLEPWMVTAHMVVALVIVTFLLYSTYHASIRRAGLADRAATPGRRRLGHALALTIVLILIQVAMGTQVRAGMEHAVDLAPDLPRGEWLAAVPAQDGIHRGFAQVVGLAVLATALWVFRRFRRDPVLTRSAAAAVVLTVAQIAIGATMAATGVPAWGQVLHLSLASLLLGAVNLAFLQTQREPVLIESEGSASDAAPETLRSHPAV